VTTSRRSATRGCPRPLECAVRDAGREKLERAGRFPFQSFEEWQTQHNPNFGTTANE
jgi:hypothetical protein